MLLSKIRGRLTYANVVSTVCLFVLLGGGAFAATKLAKNSVGSKQIKDDAIKSRDVKNDALTGADVNESKLTLPQGPVGPRGPQGLPGEDGVDGVDGEDGSPDTAAQVLAKLLTVDGAGSGLVADSLDGLDSSDFLGVNAKASDSDKLDGLDSSDFVQAEGASFIDAGLPPRTPESGFACPPGDVWADGSSSGSSNAVSYYRDEAGMVFMRGLADECGDPGSEVLTLPAGFRPAGDEYFMAMIDGLNPQRLGTIYISPSGGVVVPLGSNEVSFSGVIFRCGPSGANGCP